MNSIKRKIEYKDAQGNNWSLMINDTDIEIQCNGEARIYEIDDIFAVKHEANSEYVLLYERNTGEFYQVKFEEDKFLVIDKFHYKSGEHTEIRGSHVFGEE